jgi:GntR family transcriptional regulator
VSRTRGLTDDALGDDSRMTPSAMTPASTPLRDPQSIVVRLRDAVREMLDSGGLGPGDQIPSETELSQRFGVARGSVREALKLLEQDGLIDVQHGRGRFMSATSRLSVGRPVTQFESVTEMLAAVGYETENRVISVAIAQPDAAEAQALGLEKDAEVVRLRRLRLYENKVLVISENVFSAAILGDATLDEQPFESSLALWMAERGHQLVSAAADIQAVACPGSVSGRREVDATQPWLLITERVVDQRGAPVLLSKDYHRGDAFTFHFLRRRLA